MKSAVAAALLLAPMAASAAEEPRVSGSVTAYYYAMRDQSDFGVGVATLDRDALHLEARYNYEASDAASAFVGWTFAGGDKVSWQITPIVGALFGAARGLVPGVEASVAYGDVDLYVEAEYVRDFGNRADSYFYAWSEVGWKPVHWLRVGLAVQRTSVVDTGSDLQRGVFAQLLLDKATIGVYGFNPDSASRYLIVSFGIQF